MAKHKYDNTGNIPIAEDAYADTADKTIVIPATSPDGKISPLDESTKKFGVVADAKGNAADEPLFVLSRTSSAAHAESCRKLRWFCLENIHLLVYSIFFIALATFAVYYGFFGEDMMVTLLSAAVALFMLYAALFGHKLFVFGMPFDEERTEGVLECRFYDKDMRVSCAGEDYVLSYTGVERVRLSKHHIYLKLKSKQFPSGLLLDKPAEKSAIDGIISLIGVSKNS